MISHRHVGGTDRCRSKYRAGPHRNACDLHDPPGDTDTIAVFSQPHTHDSDRLPTLPTKADKSQCAHASLVSETIPDGQIFRPGEQFTKTWEIMNTSICTWDTSYKIVFWNGSVLGGGFVTTAPDHPAAGDCADFPRARGTDRGGNLLLRMEIAGPGWNKFRGWRIQCPFFTEIVVSDDKKPDYGITSVEYDVIRTPPPAARPM